MRILLLLLALCAPLSAWADDAVRVFAAASLTDALAEASRQWEAAGGEPVRNAFGASSTLARQIDAGAPADVFASADRAWMDWLAGRARLQGDTRVDLLGNRLVLVAPKDRPVFVDMVRGFDLAGAFEGRLCLGEAGVVPAGIYAQQGLEALGEWEALQGRLVGAEDVRVALSFVERGECALGIVYATDAHQNDRVTVTGVFPAGTHAPIVYPFALVKGARPAAAKWLAWLRGDPAARAVFERHGFTVIAD